MPSAEEPPLPVYVISLDRTAGRFASFLRRNAHLRDVVRARAVDGAGLDRNDLLARGLVAPGLGYSDAALGCALSHVGLWEQVAGLDRPATIAEDDAVFRHDFSATASRLLAGLPADWDFVLWGWNFNSMLGLDLLPGVSPAVLVADLPALRRNVDRFQASGAAVFPLPLLRAHGCPAYSVSPAGARKLLRLCLPVRPLDVPFPAMGKTARNDGVDMMMSLAYPQMRAFVAIPPLVLSEHRAETSTIQREE